MYPTFSSPCRVPATPQPTPRCPNAYYVRYYFLQTRRRVGVGTTMPITAVAVTTATGKTPTWTDKSTASSCLTPFGGSRTTLPGTTPPNARCVITVLSRCVFVAAQRGGSVAQAWRPWVCIHPCILVDLGRRWCCVHPLVFFRFLCAQGSQVELYVL